MKEVFCFVLFNDQGVPCMSTEVDECADKHVAADAAEDIEVKCFHVLLRALLLLRFIVILISGLRDREQASGCD